MIACIAYTARSEQVTDNQHHRKPDRWSITFYPVIWQVLYLIVWFALGLPNIIYLLLAHYYLLGLAIFSLLFGIYVLCGDGIILD